MNPQTHKIISAILRNDKKLTSYKVALVRSINDVVLAFPDIKLHENGVAIPLRFLADFWMAYYWSFADAEKPIYQGSRAFRDGVKRRDIVFRDNLTNLRLQWEQIIGCESAQSDGFVILDDMKVKRKRASYPEGFAQSYRSTITSICSAIEMPIRYAGNGEWSIFQKPEILSKLLPNTTLPN